jgi:hypothetical protein
VPIVNWLLMIGSVVASAVANNTTTLGNAYGYVRCLRPHENTFPTILGFASCSSHFLIPAWCLSQL